MKITTVGFVRLAAILVMFAAMIPVTGHSQIVNESTKKKISIGVGLFSDIWMNVPEGMKTRTINQGVDVYATYNLPFGKSNLSFAIGLGISIHNLYWNYMYQGSNDSMQFVVIPSTLDYKRSKITLPYLELPIEFRLKTKSKVSVAIGFKVGYMIYGHSKYVGDDYLFKTNNQLVYSVKNIKNVERFQYGPTLRVGYKWFNLKASYGIGRLFTSGMGSEMSPITVGFVLMPF